MRKISQREARRALQQLARLENQRETLLRPWASVFPGGVNVAQVQLTETYWAKVETSRNLGFVLAATLGSNNTLMIYAVKP